MNKKQKFVKLSRLFKES